MAGRILISLAIFGLLILHVHGQELNTNETAAEEFLTQTSDKMFKFFDDLTDKEYFFDVDIRRNQYKLNRNYINFVNKIVEDARKFDFNRFKDENTKYAFKILVQLNDQNVIGAKQYSRILEALKELDFLPQYKYIAKFNDTNTKLSFNPDVEEIVIKSKDEAEIEHYWAEWMKMLGEWAEKNLGPTIESIEQAANLSEVSPLEFWSRGYNITDMEELLLEIMPLYKELHAFLRNLIEKRYGASLIDKTNGRIPDHLFQQIKIQLMTNDSLIEEMFPLESLPPTVDIGETQPIRVYKTTEDFYENLGFARYPESIWQGHLHVDHEDDTGDEECEARVIYKTPNVFLNFCENMNYWDVLESYMNMGYLHYAREMTGLPAYFFSAPQRLDYAIGKTIILSASTHNNLMKIGMIPDDDISEKVEMNRLLRMAIRRLLYLPIDFVHAKVISDLLEGKIILEYVSSHYWDVMHKYAGVTKPWGLYTEFYDMTVDFYKEMNDNLMSSEFVTEILSFQLHKKLCKISGKYPKEPLHLCNIGGSKSAGHVLKEMMRPGKSKPFYQVLAIMFPENPKISAEGISEYYKPLMNMLAMENKKAKLNIGWPE
ncbi:angiotensin-converting enzyme-like [Episyrphus balteatus]|uniref:angiotensin-converting enzyme-like n=1 Tax=Episyrphus balteatus TaxID=286459 RepID=UPI002486969C|nr:angiotensin-converting enzyme-like [Episyrphus balteatus]